MIPCRTVHTNGKWGWVITLIPKKKGMPKLWSKHIGEYPLGTRMIYIGCVEQ